MISWAGSKYLKLLTVFTLFGVSLSYVQALDEGIKISKRFPKHRVKKIGQDLNYLMNMPTWKPLDEKERLLFGSDSVESQDLYKWLDSRIGFLIPKESDNRNLIVLGEDFNQYPKFDIFPIDVGELFLFTDNGSRTLMSNYGVSYYFFGKRISKIVKVDLSKHFNGYHEPLSVYSPRIGIISIHENIFKSNLYISPMGRKSADSILRISYLFHEARHSDGNGKSLGFYHMKCPPGTDYAGLLACDRSSNGSYMIGAVFLKKSLEVCADCTEEEKDSLRLHYFDSKSRVMTKAVLSPDEVEEINRLENKLDETAHQYFQSISDGAEKNRAELEKKIQKILLEIKTIKSIGEKESTIYWDATPEVVGFGNVQ
jgi:hypothetical protein